MNKVIFRSIDDRFYLQPDARWSGKIATPAKFKYINNTGLVKSILDFGRDISARVSTIDMPKNFHSYKSKEILRIDFWEPFDDFHTVSVIQMWGEGINEVHATKNLLKKLNNLYPYEELLRVSYYMPNDSNVISDSKHKYFIYDPQEMERYNNTKAYMGNLGSRGDLMPCGYIYTNAMLKQR